MVFTFILFRLHLQHHATIRHSPPTMTDTSTPNFSHWNHTKWITYGPDENCTLALCPVEASLYEYRPSLSASSTFIALFGLALAIQIIQGVKYRTWAFMIAMFWGCTCEMVGYGGRILMWQNPFSFPGFMVQIGEFDDLDFW